MDSSEFTPKVAGDRGAHTLLADDATGLRPAERMQLYNRLLRSECPLTEADIRGMWDDACAVSKSADPRAAASAIKTRNEIRMGNVKLFEVVLTDSKPPPVAAGNLFTGPVQINLNRLPDAPTNGNGHS